MKRTGLITTKLAPAVLVSAMLGLAAPLAHAADNPAAGANSPRPSAGQNTGQSSNPSATDASGTYRSSGAVPRTSPSRSNDGGYGNDSTVHRTGQEKRTNADGSDFESGQDDGPDNTTYPGD
tara:strand:- start:4525 stop:4890 length:366 start_codon:yes stop_codon:yes gene_type:complete